MGRRFSLFVLLLVASVSLLAQCPPNSIGDTTNLVINGDFEQGNTGFTSQYLYCNNFNCLQPEATYAVGPDASFFHTGFTGFDHTTGSGNFMVVNGSGTPNTNIWCQTINVDQNTTYLFSAWVQTCVASSPAILQFRINGNLIGSPFTAPSFTNQWIQFNASWVSGNNTTATICIVNQNTSTSGNDFGIDDIVFTECIPCQINQVNATGATSVCPGTPVPLLVTADTPATFVWSPSGTLNNDTIPNPIATTSSTVTYTVTATDSVGCTLEDTVTVTISNAPPYTLPDKDTLCVGDTALINLQTNASLQYSWQPNQFISCTSCQQPNVYPPTSQWYTVSVTSPTCSIVDSIYIQVVDTPKMSAGPDRIICNLPFTQLQGSYTSTTPFKTITWSPPTGLSHTYLLNPIANPANTTTYTLTITNVFGCTRSDEVDVIRTVVTADAGRDTVICPGETVQLGSPAKPKTAYSWQPATGLSNDTIAMPLATPTQSTLYTLTITDSNGCTAIDYVAVSIQFPPTVFVNGSGSICPGDSLTLTAAGAIQYHWEPASALSCNSCNPITVSPSQSTTYTVIGTNAAGCADTQTATVNVFPSPIITASGNSPICAGDTTPLVAQGGQQYSWSPANSLSCNNCPSPIAFPIGNTTYTVIGTDNNGCIDSTTVTIQTQNGPPIAVSPDTIICPGTAVALQVSGGTTYSWSPAASLSCSGCNNPVAQPTQTTTYTVTAFNPIGCNSVDTIRVTISGVGSAGITGDTAICPGDTALWQVQGLQSLTWQPNIGISCNNCPTPSLFPAQTTTYTLTGIDSRGCQITPVSKTLAVTPIPQLAVTAPDTVCAGTPISLSASGAATYQWSSAASLSCNTCANPSTILLQTTNFQLRGISAGGCFSDTGFTIHVQPQPTLVLTGANPICLGDSTLITGTSAGTFQWEPDTYLPCDTCQSNWVSPPASQWFGATATSSIGCTTKDSIWVTVHPAPVITAAPDTQICLGQPVNLQANGGVTYNWLPTTDLSCSQCPNPIATPTQDQWYTVVGVDNNGCEGIDSVRLTLARLAGLTVSEDTLICLGDTITLTAGGAVQYNWSPSSGLAQTNSGSTLSYPTDTTIYTITATDANGCSQDTTITVFVHQPLPVQAEPDTAICLGEQVQLFANNGITFQWTPRRGLSDTTIANPIAQPATTTIYTISKVDIHGCVRSETVRIAVFPQPIAEAGNNVMINEGASTQLMGVGGGQYSWQPIQWLDDPSIANPIASPADSTWFFLTTTDSNGCMASDSVLVAVIPTVKIIVPNGFSPNGDGMNDVFTIGYSKGLTISSLQVFDRWGQQVFYTNNQAQGWDGNIGATPAPVGVYMWLLQGATGAGLPFQQQGNVTLIR